MPVSATSIRRLTLVITCLGFFMVLLDASIVTVALPTIQRTLAIGLNDLQWVVDAYTLPFGVLLLIAGTVADRFGRKRVFLGGLVVFMLGSAACGWAPNFAWLFAGRILQGIGGAFLSPGSLAVLVAAFPEPQERTRVLGISTGLSGVALAAGPIIGGTLIQIAGWQWIFFVNLPIGLIVLALGARYLVESRNPAARRLDIPGQVAAVAALTALTYGLIEGTPRGWGSPLILGCFAATVAFLVIFVIVEARSPEPMLPLALFRNLVFSSANVAALVVGFALLGGVFFISQYFQAIQGASALGSGVRSLPNTMGIFIASPLAGLLAARFGFRLPVTLGALMSGTALLLLMRLDPNTPYPAIWWNLALLGLGFGLTLTPLTAAVLATTPPQRSGLAASVINTSRQIGSVLGVAVLGAIVQEYYAAGLSTDLVQHGVPAARSQSLAETIAAAGAQSASVVSHLRLPIPPAILRQLLRTNFVDALHAAFFTAGGLLLGTALLAVIALRHPTPQPNQVPAQQEIVQELSSLVAEAE